MIEEFKDLSIYGEVFGELRYQEGLSLADFQSVNISKGTLSNFENGRSMLSFDKLKKALQLMNFKVGEYELIVSNFHPDQKEKMMQEVILANLGGDRATLQRIHEESIALNESWITLATSNLLNDGLTEEEKNELRDKFFRVSTWSYFRLMVLSLTIEQLGDKLTISILKDFWERNQFYRNILSYRVLIIQAGQRLIQYYIKNGDKEKSIYILNEIEKLIDEPDILARFAQKFYGGLWIYEFVNKMIGKQIMAQILDIFCLLETPHYYQFLKKLYDSLD